MEKRETAPAASCPRCLKPAVLCLCAEIEPIANRISVLVLQHPQEQDLALGTGRLTTLHLRDATLRIGLSWPSLAKALGRPADPRRWAVLYLGSARAAELAPGRELVALDRKGAPVADQEAALGELDGIVLLDGTWSQAKALWWRNPWLLKLKRAILLPTRTSLYGELRSEPRRECLSTIESIAQSLTALGEPPSVEESLVGLLATLIERYRQYAF
jgi:hypothetical protein